jgi:hypothetical protein
VLGASRPSHFVAHISSPVPENPVTGLPAAAETFELRAPR